MEGFEVAVAEGPWTADAEVVVTPPRDAGLIQLRGAHGIFPTKPPSQVQFSPDGAFFQVHTSGGKSNEDCGAEIYSLDAKKTILTIPDIPAPAGFRNSQVVAFAADQKSLATFAWAAGGRSISVLGLPNREKILDVPALDPVWSAAVALSPDGKSLAGSIGDEVVLWDLKKKSVLKKFKASKDGASHIAFSPDSKSLLASGRLLAKGSEHTHEKFRAWNIADGRLLFETAGAMGVVAMSRSGYALNAGQRREFIPRANLTFCSGCVIDSFTKRELVSLKDVGLSAAFTPDERLVAAIGYDNLVRYFEMATGQFAYDVPLPPNMGGVMAPSGEQMAVWNSDSVVDYDLSWKSLRAGKRGPTEFDDDDWVKLAGTASDAYTVMMNLSVHPDKALAFLRARLKPESPPDVPDDAVKKWLDALVPANAPGQANAIAELKKQGRRVAEPVRSAILGRLLLESERRHAAVLTALESVKFTPDELRSIRAVAMLERLGGPDATKLLESLAEGSPYMVRAQEAKASLRRLAERK